MARVTVHHLVGWLKESIGDLCYSELFMVGFLSKMTGAYVVREKWGEDRFDWNSVTSMFRTP